MDILSRLVTPTGTKGCARHVALAAPFVPVAKPGTKPLLSRPGVPGWETGTIEVSQLGQISVSIVVRPHALELYLSTCSSMVVRTIMQEWKRHKPFQTMEIQLREQAKIPQSKYTSYSTTCTFS